MAKHEVITRENTSTTKTSAPYLPYYVKKGDLSGDRLYQLVAAEAGLTGTQVRAILEGAFAEFEALEQEGAVRIHVDGMTVYLAITGSFASADAAFDPLKNTLELAIYLDDDIKNALVNVTPAVVTDETATVVRITGIADVAVPRPYEVIHGQNPFDVQAVNNVTTDEGATAYFEGSNGTTYPATLVSSTSKQLSRYKSASLLEGGDYKFWIKSRGGDADGPLQAKFRRVKYLKVDPTPIYTSTLGGTKIYSSVDDHGNALPAGPVKSTTATSKIHMTGVLYQTPDADPDTGVSHINLKITGMDDIELMGVFSEDHKSLMIRLGECITQVPAGTYENAKLSFTCYTDGQADSLEIPIVLIKE